MEQPKLDPLPLEHEKDPLAGHELPEPAPITAAIKGYRQMSPTEQAMMNEAKDEGERVGALCKRVEEVLRSSSGADADSLRQAREHLRTGFMYLCRSIAKPTTFAAALIALLLLGMLSSCSLLGGGEPVAIASVAAYDAANPPGEKPAAIVRWDGNTFVAWGSGGATGEIMQPVTFLPLWGPVSVDKGFAYVKVNDPPFEWKGSIHDPLPAQALGAFRPAEIEAWGLNPPPAG